MDADQTTDDPMGSGAGEPGTGPLAQFVVRANGSVRGDDGASPPGSLAVTLPYLGRLAFRVGELIGAGEPVAFETAAGSRLSVQVSWNAAEEGTFRAVVHPAPVQAAAQFTVVGGGDVDAALAHCVERVSSLPEVRWSAVLTSDTRVVAAAGHDAKEVDRLPEIGTRVLAVLRSVEGSSREAWARLDYDGASVLGAAIGRHCLFALSNRVEEDEVAPVLDEVRAVLSSHDVAAATTLVAPAPASPWGWVTDPRTAPVAAAPAPSPVGARYRRSETSGHRQGSTRRGFWSR